MYHDRLNLSVRGSRRHGIQLTGNSSILEDLVCLTPLSFFLVVRLVWVCLVVRELLTFDVVFDDPLFVLRDATFFSNADWVVTLDFPDERVTFLPVEFLADVVRDFDVEVFRVVMLLNS